jgi:hypothetical protein
MPTAEATPPTEPRPTAAKPSAAQPTPRRPMPEWLKKLLASLVSILFSLLVLEAYVRFDSRGKWVLPRETLAPAGLFCCRLKGNITVTVHVVDGASAETTLNERGFRGPSVSSIAERPLRVISLGDSLTFGWGIDLDKHAMSRFAAEYSRRFPERALGHAFVASPGWDPKDYYFAYQTEVVPFLGPRPAGGPPPADVVVLGFFAGNDILFPDTPRILDPALAPRQSVLPPPIPEPLFGFPEWVRLRVRGSLLGTKLGISVSKGAPELARFNKDIDAQKPAWSTSFFYLDALREAVKQHGARLVILSYPSVVQVNSGKTLDDNGLDHTAPDRVLEAYCKEHGIDLITLLRPLEENNQNVDLYFPVDRHLNARGHEVAAKVLAEKLAPIVDRAWEERQRAR